MSFKDRKYWVLLDRLSDILENFEGDDADKATCKQKVDCELKGSDCSSPLISVAGVETDGSKLVIK